VPRTKDGCQNIVLELVEACSDAIGRDAAVKGARNLCRYFGGGMYYVPANKKTGRVVSEMREVLRDAVGERSAETMITKAMALFGGFNFYIPLERTAFEDEIAEEIYRRNAYEGVKISQLFRDYNISFAKAYQLWKKGQRIKLRKETKK
jgi:Mor family transcriptional regulator